MSLNAMVVNKEGTCPISQTPVSISGIYEKDSDGRLAFSEVHCSIIENVNKPVSQRDPELGSEPCESPGKCPIYSSFSPFV